MSPLPNDGKITKTLFHSRMDSDDAMLIEKNSHLIIEIKSCDFCTSGSTGETKDFKAELLKFLNKMSKVKSLYFNKEDMFHGLFLFNGIAADYPDVVELAKFKVSKFDEEKIKFYLLYYNNLKLSFFSQYKLASLQKDEALKEKDEAIKLVKEKDETINKIVKEKDEAINKIVKEKDEAINKIVEEKNKMGETLQKIKENVAIPFKFKWLIMYLYHFIHKFYRKGPANKVKIRVKEGSNWTEHKLLKENEEE